MKTNHISIILLFIALFFTSCREITVKTTVNTDGSFTRVITITGDSSDLFKKGLPYPVDSTWLFEVKHDTIDSSLFATYTKTYECSDVLNEEIKADSGWRRQIDRNIEVDKRFGFFYSYLSFEETIKAANPFTRLDINDYFTNEDMQFICNTKPQNSKADSARLEEIEEKVMKFLLESITDELIAVLEEGVSKLDEPGIDKGIIQLQYDSILNAVNEWEFDDASELIEKIAVWSGEPKLLLLKQYDPELFSDYYKDVRFLENILEMESYKQEVELPGIITETNSVQLKGNQVRWEVEPQYFLIKDYKMSVESRVVNYWMFVLTAGLILFFLILIAYKAFRKRS